MIVHSPFFAQVPHRNFDINTIIDENLDFHYFSLTTASPGPPPCATPMRTWRTARGELGLELLLHLYRCDSLWFISKIILRVHHFFYLPNAKLWLENNVVATWPGVMACRLATWLLGFYPPLVSAFWLIGFPAFRHPGFSGKQAEIVAGLRARFSENETPTVGQHTSYFFFKERTKFCQVRYILTV